MTDASTRIFSGHFFGNPEAQCLGGGRAVPGRGCGAGGASWRAQHWPKIIFKKKLKLEEALQILERDYKDNNDVVKLVEFIRKSKRGITR